MCSGGIPPPTWCSRTFARCRMREHGSSCLYRLTSFIKPFGTKISRRLYKGTVQNPIAILIGELPAFGRLWNSQARPGGVDLPLYGQHACIVTVAVHHPIAPVDALEIRTRVDGSAKRAMKGAVVFKARVCAAKASLFFVGFEVCYVVCTFLHMSFNQLRCKSSTILLTDQIFA